MSGDEFHTQAVKSVVRSLETHMLNNVRLVLAKLYQLQTTFYVYFGAFYVILLNNCASGYEIMTSGCHKRNYETSQSFTLWSHTLISDPQSYYRHILNTFSMVSCTNFFENTNISLLTNFSQP